MRQIARQITPFLFCIFVAIASARAGQSSTYSFTQISYPGSSATYLIGINDSGAVAGAYVTPNGHQYAFTYDKGAYTTIAVPGSDLTYASAIGNNGDVVGLYYKGSKRNGFVWNNGQFLSVGRQGYASAMSAVSSSGLAAGYANPLLVAGASATILFENGAFTASLGVPGSAEAYVAGINAEGTTVGGIVKPPYVDNSPYVGFIHETHRPVRILAPIAALNTSVQAINDAGLAVGYTSDTSGTAGFMVDGNGPMVLFRLPGATYTQPMALNQNGVVVGSAQGSTAFSTSFVLDRGQFTSLSPPGTLYGSVAASINFGGVIAGTYTDEFAKTYGYVATPYLGRPLK